MSSVVRFGSFEVDVAAGQLRKRGVRINLRDQSFQVLASLLEHAGEVVTREELQYRLWQGKVFVDYENNLNTAVARLREALCDSAERPRFIETLPRRGYRFIGELQVAPRTAARPQTPRLVVLPFLNLNGHPEQEYFSDAMTDEIITALASIAPQQMAVIARTTAMRYKGSHKDVSRIGRELGVDYVVEGALRHSADEVAINVQLIQTFDQAHVFAKRYDVPTRDIFQLQESIARDIATRIQGGAALARHVPAGVPRRQPTRNLEAYNEYIKGRYLVERLTCEAMTKAQQHFEQAISLDPDFALAHTALADLYSWLGYLGYIRPKQAYSTGIQYALRATQCDPTLPEAHTVLAEYHKQLHYDWAAAEKEMTEALELGRSSPFVRLRHAIVILMPQNRMEEALTEIQCALESDPLAAGTRFWLGIILLLARRYDAAIEEAERLLELEPSSPWPHYITGVAYRQKYVDSASQTPAAIDAATAANWADKAITGHLRALELAPRSDVLLGWLGLAYGVCGKMNEARAVLERLHASERYILPTSFGQVHLGLGEFDAAFEWFDRAVEERDQLMMPILSYAHFDPLRGDLRFSALLRKMNLEAIPGTDLAGTR